MLTSDQIEHFKAHGYVVVPGLVEPVLLDEWRRQVWAHLGEREDDPSTWVKKPYVPHGFGLQPPAVCLDEHPRFRAIIEQIGGGNFVVGSRAASPLIHWPIEHTAWQPTPWGHLDGYYPGTWWPFMVAATVYAYDCEPMGGGFTFWRDSHLSAHRYFMGNPPDEHGRFRDDPRFVLAEQNVFNDRAPHPSQTFDGNAGDVILWHSYMLHTGSTNCRRVPRMAFIARYAHRDQDSFRYEIPENLWKHWAI